MNSRHGSTARVVLILERGIPRQGFGCRAGYTWHARHALGSAVAWEMLGEDRAIIKAFKYQAIYKAFALSGRLADYFYTQGVPWARSFCPFRACGAYLRNLN